MSDRPDTIILTRQEALLLLMAVRLSALYWADPKCPAKRRVAIDEVAEIIRGRTFGAMTQDEADDAEKDFWLEVEEYARRQGKS